MNNAISGTVRNPLTVIAIFSGIAEISGTVVLPSIASENQFVFIWFLMLFPVLLVALFFFTLIFNHKVLYAPSDFKNEENFMGLISKATQFDVLVKEAIEIAEAPIPKEGAERHLEISQITAGAKGRDETMPTPVQQEVVSKVSRSISGKNVVRTPINSPLITPDAEIKKSGTEPDIIFSSGEDKSLIEVRSNLTNRHVIRAAERFAIELISKEYLNVTPRFEVKLGSENYVFDAVTQTDTNLLVWESFVVNNFAEAKRKIQRFLFAIDHTRSQMTEDSRERLSVVIIPIFSANMSGIDRENTASYVHEMMREMSIEGVVFNKSFETLYPNTEKQKSEFDYRADVGKT